MIDDLDEYEDVKALIDKYKGSIDQFRKDPKEKPRVDAMREEVRRLEAELREFDRGQKKN